MFTLCGGDLSKIEIIDGTEIGKCLDWYYTIKVNELNEMKSNLAMLKKSKNP